VVLLITAALSVGGLAAILLPEPLTPAQKNFAGAAVGCAALLIGYLAIPGVRSAESGMSSAPATSLSSGPGESEPIAWDLDLTNAGCEGFILPNYRLQSLPSGDKLNAEWAYENGGATASNIVILTVQGNSEDAVVLKGIRIVDLERSPAPSNVSAVYPCEGGGGHLDRRYFELVLDEHPRLTARPGRSVDDTITEPVKDFPFKVSNSDPEYFEFDIVDGPPCLCSWKIALDWTSRGRSGTTIIDRGFSGIRTVVTKADVPFHYLQKDGSWEPPLPK
jgi:hypothetical protein